MSKALAPCCHSPVYLAGRSDQLIIPQHCIHREWSPIDLTLNSADFDSFSKFYHPKTVTGIKKLKTTFDVTPFKMMCTKFQVIWWNALGVLCQNARATEMAISLFPHKDNIGHVCCRDDKGVILITLLPLAFLMRTPVWIYSSNLVRFR